MIKWAKILDSKTGEVQIGIGQTPEYYASIGMTEMEVEQAYNGLWYLKGYAPIKPEPTPREKVVSQIESLEKSITDRNIRAALLGDEYALNKITEIEAQIEELRKQLPPEENI